jgi:hypothetical protein
LEDLDFLVRFAISLSFHLSWRFSKEKTFLEFRGFEIPGSTGPGKKKKLEPVFLWSYMSKRKWGIVTGQFDPIVIPLNSHITGLAISSSTRCSRIVF